jgi:hypothetical protein
VSDPVIITTERYSDTLNLLHMSDGTQLWGCTWPKCNFVSGNKDSIPSHYKHHVGQAAQRRRAQARPRSAVVSNEVLEAALALLDMTQELVDKLGAFDDEFTAMKHTIDEHAIVTEGLRQQIETNRVKAERYDLMVQMMKDAGYDEPPIQ